MLTVIESEEEISSAQTLFMKKMDEMADKRDTITVGYKSGSQKLQASWSQELGIWWTTKKIQNRYLI